MFEIGPCTVDDGPALARTYISAFWTDASWVLMWRGKSRDYVMSQACRRMPKNLTIDRTLRRHQKAVDISSGAVVGYARWTLPQMAEPQRWWRDACVPPISKEQQDQAELEYAAADWTYDHSLDELDDQFLKMKADLMKGRHFFLLDSLAVHPEFRRRGIGTKLVESGIREAEVMGLDIFVHSKKAGLGVYQNLGFKLIDQLVLDDSKHGGAGEYAAYFLVKEVNPRAVPE